MYLLHSPNELREASKHVWYEIWMTLSIAKEILNKSTDNPVCANALLESFTIHARVLFGFFYNGRKGKTDDILAVDFFPDPKVWQRIRGKKDPIIERVNQRVAKEIVHLSYVRLWVGPEKKNWEILPIVAAISKLANRFNTAVASDLLVSNWRGGFAVPQTDA